MYYDYADFLRPIRENNRDEYILVEFHRTLKNTNMSLLRNLFLRSKDDPEILELFPNLVTYAKLSIDERYDATVQFNYPDELVFNLSKEKLSPELCRKYVEAFIEPYHFEYLHATRMEAILRNLLGQAFVKKVYVFADKFTTEMKAYMAETFKDVGLGTRVVAIEGGFVDCMLSMPEITTVFMSNTSDFTQLYEFNPEAINGKFFIISDGYDNLEPCDDGENFQYAKMKLFDSLNREKKAVVAYGYPHAIYKAI